MDQAFAKFKKDKKIVGAYISEAEYTQFKQFCERLNTTVSKVLRRLVKEELNRYKEE